MRIFIFVFGIFISGFGYGDCERYTVQKGDSFSKIAKNYGVSPQDLEDWNHVKSNKGIYIGQIICVSPPRLYQDLSNINSIDISPVTINQENKISPLTKINKELNFKYKTLLAQYNNLKKQHIPKSEKKTKEIKTNNTLDIIIIILIISFMILILLFLIIYGYRKQEKIKRKDNCLENENNIKEYQQIFLSILDTLKGVKENNKLLKNNKLGEINDSLQQRIIQLEIKNKELSESSLKQRNKMLRKQLRQISVKMQLLKKQKKITSIPQELDRIDQSELIIDEVIKDFQQNEQQWADYSEEYQENINQINQAIMALLKQTNLNTILDPKDPIKTLNDLTQNIQSLETTLAEKNQEKEELIQAHQEYLAKIIKTIPQKESDSLTLIEQNIPQYLEILFNSFEQQKMQFYQRSENALEEITRISQVKTQRIATIIEIIKPEIKTTELLTIETLPEQLKKLFSSYHQNQHLWEDYSKEYKENINQINQVIHNLLKQTNLHTPNNSKDPIKTLNSITQDIQTLEATLATVNQEKESLAEQVSTIINTIQPQVSPETILKFNTLPTQLEEIFNRTKTYKTQIDNKEAEQAALLTAWQKDKEVLLAFDCLYINESLKTLEDDFIAVNKDEIRNWYPLNEILAGFEEVLYWHEWLVLPLDNELVNSLGHLLELTKIIAAQSGFCIYKYPLDANNCYQPKHSFDNVFEKLMPLCQNQKLELTELIVQNILDLFLIVDNMRINEDDKKEFLTLLFGEQGESLEIPEFLELQTKRTRKRIYRFEGLNIQIMQTGQSKETMTTQRY